MIKFFRKIRQKLLTQDKFSKYLFYAIGEIFLVVIGILIALSINNWNEKRKNHMTLTSNLQGVLEELKVDSATVAFNLDDFTEFNKKRIAFINHTNYESFTRDSLEQRIENFHKGLNMEGGYYQKIRNTDITEYGVYEKIMEEVIYYFDYILPYLNYGTAIFDEQVAREDEYWRYEQKIYEFNYVEGLNSAQNEELAKKELIKLINSVTARNILKLDVRRNTYMIEHLTEHQTYLKEMIHNLKKALQQKRKHNNGYK